MKQILILFTTQLVAVYTIAQGCSDAGFCSLNYKAASQKNAIAIGNVSGIGEGSTFINSNYISYARQLSKKWVWNTKLTTNYASGKLANNFNVGDVFTDVSINAWQSTNALKKLTLLTGIKIPLTSANDKAGGKPLPMAYQASLGTFDLIMGANVQINQWEFTNAWQIPLTAANKNTFFAAYAVSNDFPSTNNFNRKADVLLRTAYSIHKKGRKFFWKPNLLAIYHLGNDSYDNIFGKEQLIQNSKGLTVNANIIGRYAINQKQSIELSIATPLVVREVRPDGLTRRFTAGIEYKIAF